MTRGRTSAAVGNFLDGRRTARVALNLKELSWSMHAVVQRPRESITAPAKPANALRWLVSALNMRSRLAANLRDLHECGPEFVFLRDAQRDAANEEIHRRGHAGQIE